MNHMPWDEGAIADAFTDVFGASHIAINGQKTIKTMCGKRVPVGIADHNGTTTCPDCAARIAEKQRGLERLREAVKQYGVSPCL